MLEKACSACGYRHGTQDCLKIRVLPPGISSEDRDHPWVASAKAQMEAREAVDARKRLRLQRAGRKGAEARQAARARQRGKVEQPATPQRAARLRREGWRSGPRT